MAEVGAPLPFQDAIDFFRQKVNVPTQKWTDIQNGAHTRAFTVAGANREDMLADFREAVDKAISQGISLGEFRKSFDKIVKDYGWSYNGTRGWRSKTIYATNVQTAYAAGRYKQMTDPDVVERRPYWQYMLGDSKNHRKDHAELAGLILRYDDPFWDTHYPPSGWGCKCWVRTLSENDLDRMGVKPSKITNAQRNSVAGIQKGWRYNVGEAAYGKPIAENVFAREWQNMSPVESGAYQKETTSLPVRPTNKTLLPNELENAAACKKEIETTMGGQTTMSDPTGAFVYVDAENLASHLYKSRHSQSIPFMTEVVQDPEEIWVIFEKNPINGKYRVRKSYIRRIETGKQKPLIVVAEGEKGVFKEITTYVKENVDKSRQGVLIYKKKGG